MVMVVSLMARREGEVFRRDRLTKDEGEQKCRPASPSSPASCTATATSSTQLGGNFDFDWDR